MDLDCRAGALTKSSLRQAQGAGFSPDTEPFSPDTEPTHPDTEPVEVSIGSTNPLHPLPVPVRDKQTNSSDSNPISNPNPISISIGLIGI